MNVEQTMQETLTKLAAINGGSPDGVYIPGYGLVAKDVVQKDVTTATGLNAYNLEPAAKILQPVYSPFRNRVPRPNTGKGTAANWKVITSLDISRTDPFTAEGTKASTVNVTVSDKSAAYKTISKGDNVTFQSQWSGKTFIDQKAAAAMRLLATVMQLEEQGLLFARSSALGSITTPTTATATTGGTIAAATYNVVVRAISFPKLGATSLAAVSGRGKKSSAASQATTGSTSTLSASTTAVEGALAYEWYVGTAGNEKLEAITEVAHVKLLTLAGTGQALSGVSDDSADTNAFDGLIAQITAAVSTPSVALANGTAGAGTKLRLSNIDDYLQNTWDTYRADPDVMYLNSREHRDICDLVQAASGLMTQIFTEPGQQVGLTAGMSFGWYVNRITGKKIKLEVHPFWPKGTIMFATFSLPFAIPGLDNIVECETRQEYLQLDYPVVAPKFEMEVLVDEVLKVYFPGAFGYIKNIASQTLGA